MQIERETQVDAGWGGVEAGRKTLVAGICEFRWLGTIWKLYDLVCPLLDPSKPEVRQVKKKDLEL